jgi:hypothetical protein
MESVNPAATKVVQQEAYKEGDELAATSSQSPTIFLLNDLGEWNINEL